MTTASLTEQNISNLTPIATICRRTDGSIAGRLTAVGFSSENFRHLINRRFRWSDSAEFVAEAIARLIREVNPRAATNTSMTPFIENLTDIVRTAANRRRSFNKVYEGLVGSVERLIYAAERCV